ncbi:flavin reductase family protein [Methylovirgula ligni]|uniref:Flavin reductase (DIM6/NTAB) family NADH-FMN oxidoreductase RutF n=1 Tax=Methylovirgula ligni TaxID=569860 RepID=A0A3D9Z287_9HYPH|nr:flavin reductase family protein [Methylovirgula ligni]QAY95486.1 flavin reductase family protein [Methylovirgula ligni]REF89181.1 flavin reductase (DIM6/NTAB) family NADH-FMN oxidoreductase RutF [Methylovirgula ligni]
MQISAESLSAEQAYRLLSGVVVPRPIAWVTTLSPNGKVNAAPFSAFTFLSTEPPMIGFGVTHREGRVKDTERNIRSHGEFAVNIADTGMLAALHKSSEALPIEVSEVELLELELADSLRLRTPRLAGAPVSFECRAADMISFGRWHVFVVGEILVFHIRDGLMVDGKIETAALNPIARIGGPFYAELGKITVV